MNRSQPVSTRSRQTLNDSVRTPLFVNTSTMFEDQQQQLQAFADTETTL